MRQRGIPAGAYQQSVSIGRASQRIDERDSGATKSFSSSHASLSV